MNGRAREILDHHLREAIHRIIRDAPAGPPVLRDVYLEQMPEDRGLRLRFAFHSDGRGARQSFNYHINSVELLHELPSRGSARGTLGHDISRRTHQLYSEMVEDHIIERELRSMRIALDNAVRVNASPSLIHELGSLYREREQHLRRDRAERREPRRDWRERARDLIDMPAPDAAQLRLQQMQYMQQQLQAGLVPDGQAEKKGLDLFMANLTPEQKASYETNKCIEVKGGKTGKRYRINHGRQQNIHELDKDGKITTGWCFLPQGNLVVGDVMLAQKTALELYEDKALEIANKFTVYGDGRLGGMADFTAMVVNTLNDPRVQTRMAENVSANNPLLSRLRRVEEQAARYAAAYDGEARALAVSLTNMVEQFRNEQDDSGQLRYRRFDEVRVRMGTLMAADPSLARMPDGQEKLRRAYEMAVAERGPDCTPDMGVTRDQRRLDLDVEAASTPLPAVMGREVDLP